MGKKFSLYTGDPSTLDQDSLLEYKEALSRYPYCQYAQLMFLLNLKQADDEETYRAALPFVAISLPDRIRLKEQVDSLSPSETPVRMQTETPRQEILPRRQAEGFSPWSQALPRASRSTQAGSPGMEQAERKEAQPKHSSDPIENPGFKPVTEEKETQTVSVDAVRTLLHKNDMNRPAAPLPEDRPAARPRVRADDIIDRFLNSGAEHPIMLDNDFDYSSFDPDTGNSAKEDFSFGSETLAEMYLANHAPQKAIAVYENLCLKFPEKSRYFANLIRKVKKDYSIK